MFSRDMMARIFLQVQKGRITLMAPMAKMFSSEVKALMYSRFPRELISLMISALIKATVLG